MRSAPNHVLRMYDHPQLLPRRSTVRSGTSSTPLQSNGLSLDLPFGCINYDNMEHMCQIAAILGLCTAAAADELLEHTNRLCGNHCSMLMSHWDTFVEPLLTAYAPSRPLVAKVKKSLLRETEGGQVTCFTLVYNIDTDTYSVKLTDPTIDNGKKRVVKNVVPNARSKEA